MIYEKLLSFSFWPTSYINRILEDKNPTPLPFLKAYIRCGGCLCNEEQSEHTSNSLHLAICYKYPEETILWLLKIGAKPSNCPSDEHVFMPAPLDRRDSHQISTYNTLNAAKKLGYSKKVITSLKEAGATPLNSISE